MSQEFNKVSTTSNLIKNLLIATYLPLIRTVRDYEYLLRDRLYIYKCNIIKCTKSGYIVTGYQYANFNGERAEFRVLDEYYFGERNDKLCTNYISNSEGYDAITHERLGKYLRSLRDMYDLNLMPLYNCFSDQIFRSHRIICTGEWSKDRVEKTSDKLDTKVYKVPIRFNTDYTICIENLDATTFAPAFIKNNNLLKINNNVFGNNVDVTNKYSRLYRTGVIKTITGLRFKDPIKIRFNNIPCTRYINYTITSPKELDAQHDPKFYQLYTSSSMPRFIYYIKNEGYYEPVNITEEEYNQSPSLYYRNENGLIVQCDISVPYDPEKVYYIFDENRVGVTFLPTSLTPDNNPDNLPLYMGADPSTGRTDSAYNTEKRYLIYNEETKTLIQNIEKRDNPHLYIENKTLKFTVDPEKVYDSANYQTVCLWRRCANNESFDKNTTYYTREGGIFTEWHFILDENEYNNNKSFYYIKISDDEYKRCDRPPVTPYDPDTIYYVNYMDSYITAEEYYFIYHQTEFYIATGFTQPPEKYYKLENNVYIPCDEDEVFDINTQYAIQKNRELFTWRYLNSKNEWVYATESVIKEGVKYYAGNDVETIGTCEYDITEENCIIYDMLEDNLYLLIQVPKGFDSNIVVLEGDYTSTHTKKYIDDAKVDMLPKPMADYLYTTRLSLMEMPTKKIIPFADTLIEFLLWNAINNLDSINNNMDRLALAVEKILDTSIPLRYTNFWFPDFRKLVYRIGDEYNNMPVRDNLGYVTKNLEQVIFTTRNNESYINDYETFIEEETI